MTFASTAGQPAAAASKASSARRYGVHTKTEAVDLALRHLAGQPMTREEALALQGSDLIEHVPPDSGPRVLG